jgi:hypothetical protein
VASIAAKAAHRAAIEHVARMKVPVQQHALDPVLEDELDPRRQRRPAVAFDRCAAVGAPPR